MEEKSHGVMRMGRWAGVLWSVWAIFVTGCEDEKSNVAEPESPPEAVTVQVKGLGDTLAVGWTPAKGALAYRVEVQGPSKLQRTVPGGVTEVRFTSADGLEDGKEYTARVFAQNAAGETPSSNAPKVTSNFFPWDEYYPTSLHRTGMGKQTFYNASPNGGFEILAGIPYQNLACRSCHTPGMGGPVKGARGCQSCHTNDNPQLGAKVDDSLATGVCLACHGRQRAEAVTHAYPDVHRAAGMTCMDCHTLGDVHGDGKEYKSMLEPGAIDAKCQDCHTRLGDNTFHRAHLQNVDCSACHAQSIVTCNNCHFESEIEANQKIPYGQFKDWKFLVNRNGKVTVANYQSVIYRGKAIVAFAPYHAHTIVRWGVKDCTDCHRNAAVRDWFEDGVVDVVWWEASRNDPQGKNLNYRRGIIPVPPNFKSGGMRFDFVTLDRPGGTRWSFVKTGADIWQILYATPLTQAQMEKLR